MGIPGFARWIMQRYPLVVKRVATSASEKHENPVIGIECARVCVSLLLVLVIVVKGNASAGVVSIRLIQPHQLLQPDELYIDMNGVIHQCAHPDKGRAPSSDREMEERVRMHLARVVSMVNPTTLLMISFDGTASRCSCYCCFAAIVVSVLCSLV